MLRSADTAPGQQDILTFAGENDNNYEITSLVGTVSINGVHLHIAISDSKGNSFGGHLKEGCLIHPTAEIVIGEDEGAVYTRELDEQTGYSELKIYSRR